MNNFSHEYVASLVVVIVSLVTMFGYTIGSDVVSAIIVVLAGAWTAYRRFKKGDIRITGLKKI